MTNATAPDHLLVAVTGASGALIARRVLECLQRTGTHASLVISKAGMQVIREELDDDPLAWAARYGVTRYAPGDWNAPFASGSVRRWGMVVVPCSMGSMSRIHGGAASNLIERAADVCLKERFPLVLVPRETPMHAAHLERLAELARLGAQIVPAMPAWYQGATTIEGLADTIVQRIGDQFGFEWELAKRWGALDREPAREAAGHVADDDASAPSGPGLRAGGEDE
jgi:4-hydroxy-3-polyprenylbenzoate decarboxylase